MKKVILFARVSSEHQSYERQKDLLLPLIESDGYSLEDIAFIEYKESAIKNDVQNRKSIQELKDIISENEIRNVYVTEISRLARRNDVMYNVLALLEEKKIALVVQSPQLIRTYEYINGAWTKNHIADVIIAFMQHLAVSEMEVKKERMMSGRERSRINGYITTSIIKFGYDKVDKCAVINKEKAALIVKIFKDYACGKSTGAIWEDIKHLGFLNVNEKYRNAGSKRIYDILTDITYIGKNPKIKYPQIVDENLFNKVQKLLKENKLVKTKTGYIYYCQGLIKYDGHTLSPNAADAVYYYKTKTDRIALNINVLDSMAQTVAAVGLSIYHGEEREQRKEEYTQRLDKLNIEIKEICKKIDAKDKEIDKLNEMYQKSKIKEDKYEFNYNKVIEEIDYLGKEKSEREIAIIEIEQFLKDAKSNNMQQVKDYNSLIKMSNDTEIYNYIHSAIESINVTKVDDNTFDMKVKFTSKAVPDNGAVYRYVRQGCKIKLYLMSNGTINDWTENWNKRILRKSERDKLKK